MTVVTLALAAAAGAAVGAVFAGLLWLSVRGFLGGGPGWLLVVGALARVAGVTAAAWWLLASGRPPAELVAAAAGFLAVRLLATRAAARGGQAG